MVQYYPVALSPDTRWVVMSIVKLYELDPILFTGTNLKPWRETLNTQAFEK